MTTLEDIRARWAAATPGPWATCGSATCDCGVVYGPDKPGSAVTGPMSVSVASVERPNGNVRADVLAIAAAPADVAWLVARVEALEADRAALLSDVADARLYVTGKGMAGNCAPNPLAYAPPSAWNHIVRALTKGMAEHDVAMLPPPATQRLADARMVALEEGLDEAVRWLGTYVRPDQMDLERLRALVEAKERSCTTTKP